MFVRRHTKDIVDILPVICVQKQLKQDNTQKCAAEPEIKTTQPWGASYWAPPSEIEHSKCSN